MRECTPLETDGYVVESCNTLDLSLTAAQLVVGQSDVVVTNPDEITMRATYGEIKRAHQEQHHAAFRVVVNRAHDEKTGLTAFRRLADTTRRFVGIELKNSYYQQAVRNLKAPQAQGQMFTEGQAAA